MRVVGRVAVNMRPISDMLRRKGLTPAGDVQQFHTQNVLRRIVKYMPYRTGATIKVTVVQTDIRKPQIVTDVPFGKYLYYGKVMVGRPPKHAIDRPLRYTKTKNPQAGPYWDRRLVVEEGRKLTADLQGYINRKAGRK